MRAYLGIALFGMLLWPVPAAHAGGVKKVLLLYQGPDGHPAKTHEYEAGQKLLGRLLEKAPGLEATLVKADEPWREGPELLAKADGAVLFLSEGAKWLSHDSARLKAFQDLAGRKGGLVALHWAMGTRDAKPIEPFVNLFGACHGGPDRKYKVLSSRAFLVDRMHPLCRGLPTDFTVRDEFYYKLKTIPSHAELQPLVQVEIDGSLETVAWAWQRPDGGRSFGFSGLHFHENWQVPEYRRLVSQAVLWAMKAPVPAEGFGVELGK
jgi:hypothetical protein